MKHYRWLPPHTTTIFRHIPPCFLLPFGRVRGCKPKVPTAKITILIPWFPCTIMHHELLQRWDERSKPRGSASPSFDQLKNNELPQTSGWFVNAANQVHIGELQMSSICSFISFMSLSNLANPIEWGLQSTYWRSQMTGLKVKEIWTSVCKPWTQSPQMWPGGIKDYRSTWNDAGWSMNLLKQFWEHLGKQFHTL